MTTAEPLGCTDPFSTSTGWKHRYGDEEISQFRAADLIARRWELSREEMERFALISHERAAAALDAGRFDREIVPVDGVTQDEGPRRDTSTEKMAKLEPLREGGRITAALASQISDGASSVLVASERAVRQYRLTPRARAHHPAAGG